MNGKLNDFFNGALGIVVTLVFIALIIAVIGLVIIGVFDVLRFLGYNFNYILLILIAVMVIYIFTFDKGDKEKHEITPFIIKHKFVMTVIGLGFMFFIFKYDKYFRIYTDGSYCAKVNVYNPNTEHESDYDLHVEVSDGAVSKIYWNNGGWLDESHFDLNDSNLDYGKANFNDDRNREFYVKLIGKGTNCK